MQKTKKSFLFIMIFVVLISLASCDQGANSVRINFDKDEYTLRQFEELEVKPTISKSESMGVVELVYSSSNPSIVEYVNGKLVAKAEGTATIKVAWSEKESIFDKATVTVTKASLPSVDLTYKSSMYATTTQTVTYKLIENHTEATATFEALTKEIATIDENGVVTALKAGEAKFAIVVSDKEETERHEFKITVVSSNYLINYNLDGGTNNKDNPSSYDCLLLPLELKEPTKEGYKFLGWYMAEELVTEIPAGTTGNIDLTAKWEILEYSITYDLDGGENAVGNPEKYTVLDEVILLAPTKEGYKFLGWYAGETLVETIAEGSTGDVELTAKWEKIVIKHQITYTLDGGVLPEGAPTEFVEGEGLTTLPTPTKEGYKFLG